MNRSPSTHALRQRAFGVGLALMMLAQPALAALNSPLSVSLIAPGGFVTGVVVGTVITEVITATPIAELASVDPTLGLHAGDAGNLISSFWMLPGESITFVDHAILLQVAAGTQRASGDLVTGYLGLNTDRARFTFDNLAIAGQTIVGAQLSAISGVISGTGGGLTAPGQVSFYLDDLKFSVPGTGTGNAFGEFRIDLLTQAVPEPASWALMLAGLAGLSHLARRAKARDQTA